MKCVLADTGPLVAILDRMDQDHAWAVREGKRLPPKMFSCEAVLSEVHFLTRDIPEAKNRIERWLVDGWLELPFSVRDHHSLLHELMTRYASVPMSFADACLVCMVEDNQGATVLTADSHFTIYRQQSRRLIPLIAPF